MGKIVVGILAHVDAGKTTLSEGMLYTSGAIRTMGRVDNRDAFLDTYALERERGITIFSKQAVFPLGTTKVTLLDTPGHVDFSPEMERTLQVLDYAILVISGADGVQGHTRTLWNLLRRYEIPTFVFINKMDQKGTDAEVLLQELKNVLEEGCVDFSTKRDVHFYEEAAVCSEDLLDRNWQRLILTHLMETEHRGVLTGAPITDIRITLVSGKAHLKHTEGGDFRQAVYRAVRQGLKQADSVLLEPYYEYRLELPSENVGRAMTDIERMHGTFGLPQTEADRTILTGMAPVSTMRDYQKEVHAYTRGNGTLQCTLKGYAPCHNTEEVLAATGYDSERDTLHPTGSVFCAHGAGFLVPWYEVKEYMHLPSIMQEKPSDSSEEKQTAYRVPEETDAWIDTEEVDRIIAQSVGANKKQKTLPKKKVPEYYKSTSKPKKQEVREEYLLVDGYNVIFAWEDLKDLAQVSIDGARGKLLDVLCDYQGMKKCNLIVVFDAYRVQGHKTEISTYHNIHVVFTKEAETADQYIEKFAHENGKKYNVTVATSDGLEQIIIRGQGCRLLSARELKDEIERTKKTLFEEHPQESKKLSLSLKDML